MRMFLAALAVLSFSGAALAAETEGEITKLNKDAGTITLDDGKSYKLPGEFDIADLSVGDDIVLAYDVVNGENLITDMTLPGE